MVLLQSTAAVVQEPLPTPQLVLAVALALGVFIIVIELVRRQKLREEYAFLWMGTSALLMVMAIDVSILAWFANLVSAESPSSILFFGALVFLMLISLQFSVRLTKLTFRNKTLSQRVALLEQSIEECLSELSELRGSQTEAGRQELDQGAETASAEEPIVTLPTPPLDAESEGYEAPTVEDADPRPEPKPWPTP